VDYYVFKNNEQVGPFPLMDVRERLKNGTFAYDDLAWREGTPHSVSESTPRALATVTAPKTLRLATSIVVFVIAFAVIAAAAWLAASFVCAVGVAVQAAISQRIQGAGGYVEIGKNACLRDFWIIATGSAVFALVVSPVVAWMMAFSNLFPWCRAR
jgi:hypothetical protein